LPAKHHGTATVLSVTQGADGVWTVSEQGINKASISYFSTKWSAMKHAVRAAKTKRNCQVRVVDPDGQVEASRLYGDREGGLAPPA
jgi:hypothetical protein